MQKKPNVLFIVTDDQRFDTIHALGNKEIITPNLDKLVQRGTSFVRAHIAGWHLRCSLYAQQSYGFVRQKPISFRGIRW